MHTQLHFADRQPHASVTKLFDGARAAKYAKGCENVEWSGSHIIFEALKNAIDAHQDNVRAIDLGSNNSPFGGLVKSRAQRAFITAVDGAKDALEEGIRLGNIDEAIVGDITALPKRLQGYDLAICAGTLDFLTPEQIPDFARQLKNVLKENGAWGVTIEPLGTPLHGVGTLQHDTQSLKRVFAEHGLITHSEQSFRYKNFGKGLQNGNTHIENIALTGTLG